MKPTQYAVRTKIFGDGSADYTPVISGIFFGWRVIRLAPDSCYTTSWLDTAWNFMFDWRYHGPYNDKGVALDQLAIVRKRHDRQVTVIDKYDIVHSNQETL